MCCLARVTKGGGEVSTPAPVRLGALEVGEHRVRLERQGAAERFDGVRCASASQRDVPLGDQTPELRSWRTSIQTTVAAVTRATSAVTSTTSGS